ncbi:PEGA domain-containing protein [Planctomycetales bacterium ZRK34]|nr:PEGA domain-containing protein [Planctomycetales bacterium ZRK34]
MKRGLIMVMCVSAVAMLGGCIQRTITIESNPPGALVHLNDVEVGRTPVTVPFTFYGVYDVRLQHDGYQTLNTSTKAQTPWWENPGPDLVAEALPGEQHVDLKWHYELQPAEAVDEDLLIDHAKQLRATFSQSSNAPAAK